MNRKPYFIWLIGHNASGKSTLAAKLAHEFNIDIVNGDDFRNFLVSKYKFFNGLEFSKLSHPKYQSLNVITQKYRISTTSELIANKNDVIYDGSGYTQELRSQTFDDIKQSGVEFKTIIISINIDEDELLKRLRKRDATVPGSTWVQKYHQRNKKYYKTANKNECDLLLNYNQNNFSDIKHKLELLLKNEA